MISEDQAEKMARAMLKNGGHNPDKLVQPGEPEMFQTPSGVTVFAVNPQAAEPLWRFFLPAAKSMLAIARAIDAEVPLQVVTLTPTEPANEAAA